MSLRSAALAATAALAALSACKNDEGAPASVELPRPTTGNESSASRTDPATSEALAKLEASMPVSDAASYHERGMTFLAAGERGAGQAAYKRAAADFQKASELDPTMPGAWSNLAMAFIRLNRPADAIEPISRALELSPKDARMLAMRASAYSRAGQDDKAVADYTAALAIENVPAFRFNRGNAQLRLGNKEDAAKDFRAVAEAPNAPAQLKTEANGNLAAIGER